MRQRKIFDVNPLERKGRKKRERGVMDCIIKGVTVISPRLL